MDNNNSLFANWREIKDFAEKHNLKELARRLQLNNDCWWSSGEFGRDQVAICDAIRFAENEDEALEIASDIDAQSGDYMKW